MKNIYFLIVLLVCLSSGYCYEHETNFPETNGRVTAFVRQGDYIYLGGDFTVIGGESINRLARVNVNTNTVDNTWSPNVNDDIFDLFSDGTNIYFFGNFTSVGGTTRNRAAKVAISDASLDATFNPNLNNTVLGTDFDGTYFYIGGNFTTVGGTSRSNLAKISTDGSLQAGNPAPNNIVRAVEVSGSDLYIGGQFTSVDGQGRLRLAKINATSMALDGTFNPGANNIVSALVIHDGDLYVGGDQTEVDGQAKTYLARVDASDGSLDNSFESTVSGGMVRAMDVYNSKLAIVGDFTSIDGQVRSYNALVDFIDGSVDTDFIFNGDARNRAVYTDGSNLYIGGEMLTLNGTSSDFVARITNSTPPEAYAPLISQTNTTSASFTSEIFSNNESTTVTFEYGTVTGDYSATTTNQTISGGSTTTTVSFNNTGLDDNEQYFVRARAENSTSFSYSTETSFWTLTDEPETHTNSFAQVGEANTSISFSFQSLNTITADGYVLLRSTANIENPVDGSGYSVDDNLGSTVVVGKITDANTTEFVLNNQQFQKSYTFKLVPFNVGDDPATTNYFITDAPTINAYTIPTLGEWGMMAFVGLMAIGGVFFVRKRIV